MHRVDASLIERKVHTTAEELFTIVSWAANTTRGRAGVAPVQAAFGMIPRDPLSTQAYDSMTTRQTDPQGQFFERVRTKSVALSAYQEEVVKAKMARSAHGVARSPGIDEILGPESYSVGDEVEVYRQSDQKDISGWRGPGVIVSLGPKPGEEVKSNSNSGVRVAWQGGEDHVGLDQIRP